MSEKDVQRIARARVLMLLVALMIAILLARLGYLQLVQGSDLEEASQVQRHRQVSVPAPRGQILDRNRFVLATSKPSYVASLVYTGKPLPDATVSALSQILQIEPERIREREKQLSARPFEPIPLKVGLTPSEHIALEEARNELIGVTVSVIPVREYPDLPGIERPEGSYLASHVLGYVLSGEGAVLTRGAWGLELGMEGPGNQAESDDDLLLQGRSGVQLVEVDFRGRPTSIQKVIAPRAGNNLLLTLDAKLQARAELALRERMEFLRTERTGVCPCPASIGALVAIDVNTGGILAMASEPSFDPNIFSQGALAVAGSEDRDLFNRSYQQWSTDGKGRPLVNHAIQEAQPPGSTFKPITALAALREGATNPSEVIMTTGRFYFGSGSRDYKADWSPGGHGAVNLIQAIARSANSYFYTMGSRVGIRPIEAVAREFGLGVLTGLEDIAGEIAGTVAGPIAKEIACAPTSSLCHGESWYYGDTLNASIGQGFNRFTTLQMAVMTATLANGGTRYRPYLVEAVEDPEGRLIWRKEPEVMHRIDFDPAHLKAIQEGMRAVTMMNGPAGWGRVDSPAGTAYGSFSDFPAKTEALLGKRIEVAAKTGTAESGGSLSHGWFIAYAPYDDPEVAIAVYIEHGGGGSLAGAPVARAFFDEYFGLTDLLAVEEDISEEEDILDGGQSGEGGDGAR